MLLKLYGPFLSAVLNSLKESFDQALQRDDVKAIVVTGAKGKFSGGFDLNVLGGLREGKAMTTGLEEKHGCESVHILSDTMEMPNG
ncbi:glyoxysomal fatty acid beta-oxidation multifunctional protein MFP-a [Helianthus annuus]|nr:glyoxysomal fatty acid beta-oxidation multifunctional protein MFP-a [Helianthus annuus]